MPVARPLEEDPSWGRMMRKHPVWPMTGIPRSWIDKSDPNYQESIFQGQTSPTIDPIAAMPIHPTGKVISGREAFNLDKPVIKAIRRWLRGQGDKPSLKTIYRGVSKYAPEFEGTKPKYTHATPWASVASRGGKGAFGSPSGHDVHLYKVTPDVKYYRGGALEGDPLETTRLINPKGMTWDKALDETKKIYQNEVIKRRADIMKRYRRGDIPEEFLEEELKYSDKFTAHDVVNDLIKGTFETDLKERPGIWEGYHVPYELNRRTPKLRSNIDLQEALEEKIKQGYPKSELWRHPEAKILERSSPDKLEVLKERPKVWKTKASVLFDIADEYAPNAPNIEDVSSAFGDRVSNAYRKFMRSQVTNPSKDFFPTSKTVAKRMIDWVSDNGKRPLGSILEPHAGEGHLVSEIKELTGTTPSALELDPDRVISLYKKGISAKQGDFLNYSGKHDTIIMNPPFSKGQAKLHILKAIDSLNEGGKGVSLVSSQDLLPGGPLRRWIESNPNVEFIGFTNMPNQAVKGKYKTVGIVGFTKPK